VPPDCRHATFGAQVDVRTTGDPLAVPLAAAAALCMRGQQELASERGKIVCQPARKPLIALAAVRCRETG
jgi:hypothetical protein